LNTRKYKKQIKVKIVNAKLEQYGLPKYATQGSAGMDLYACIENSVVLQPGERKLINTGIAIQIEDSDLAGFVFARSGMASKRGIALSNGVGLIDSDYTDELKVAIVNLSNCPQEINSGDRIAQLVIMPVYEVEWIVSDELVNTERNGGFGSTGM
jgi:dUTP pyrophosphatase